MATDWDKELAKIDKQLASISDEELLRASAPPPAKAGAAGTKAPPAKPAGKAAPTERAPRRWTMYLRVALGLALGVGILFWPKATYPIKCGVNLFLYLGLAGLIGATGIWGAMWSWRHRAAAAHVTSLLVTAWGITLAAMEVLPRIGYAIPSAERPATWTCG